MENEGMPESLKLALSDPSISPKVWTEVLTFVLHRATNSAAGIKSRSSGAFNCALQKSMETAWWTKHALEILGVESQTPIVDPSGRRLN